MKLTYITAGNLPSRWTHTIQVVKMAQAFQQIGQDVDLVTTCSLRDWNKDISADIWEHYGISTSFKLTRFPLRRLIQKEIKRSLGRFSYGYFAALYAKYKSADLVFARNYLAPYWSSRIGIPTIAETHGDPDENYQKKRLYKATKMNSFRALVTISEILAEKYTKAGVPENKIIVEQDGVDFSMFSTIREQDVLKLRKTLLNRRKAIALYAGHLYDYKGIPIILEVARILHDVSFILVGGWDTDIRRVESMIAESGLGNIRLIGFVPNNKVPVYLKASDILLLPNSGKHHQASTTSPLKLFEYMAAGRPIVASAISNIVSVLSHERNACLYDTDDMKGLVSSIKSLLINKKKASELAQQAQTDAKKYDWRQRCKRILDFAGF